MSTTTTTIAKPTSSNNSNKLPTRSNVKLLSRDSETGKLFLKVFLLDTTLNGNHWGVDPSTVDENIQTAKGKPLVLYRDSGQEPDRSWYPRMKGMYNHPPWDDNDVNHTLEMQETYRVGNIIDVNKNLETGAWWGTVEVTNPGLQKILNESPTLPFYVSPSVRMLHQNQASQSIKNWMFMHSAIVSVPAFGVQKAYASGRCSGDKESCVLQFRNASLVGSGSSSNNQENNKPRDCGFCTYEAMKQASEHAKQNSGTTNQTNYLNTSHVTNSPNFQTGQSLSDPNTRVENAGVSNAATVQEAGIETLSNGTNANPTQFQPQNNNQQGVTVETRTYPQPTQTTISPNNNTNASTQSRAVAAEGRNNTNSNSTDVDLLVQIERRKNQLSAAYQQINKLARDNQKLAREASTSNVRLASMEKYVQEQQRMARENQIADLIYNANLADLVPEDVKENQIKFLVSTPLSVEDIKNNVITPLYHAFDSYLEAQRGDDNGTYQNFQVPQMSNAPNTANASSSKFGGARLPLRAPPVESNTKNASGLSTSKFTNNKLAFQEARELAGISISDDNVSGGPL